MMMRNSAKMMKMIAIWILIDLYFLQIEIAVSTILKNLDIKIKETFDF